MTSKITTKKKVIRNSISTSCSVSFMAKKPHDLLVGYDFILLVNATNGKSTQISGTRWRREQLYQSEPVHQKALACALKQGIYHYEWTQMRVGKIFLYQTTCVALRNPDGKIQNVLSLSRDVTHSLCCYQLPVDESGEKKMQRTFAQILLDAREIQKKEFVIK